MKIVVNLLNGHKAEFNAEAVKIDKAGSDLIITEVPAAKVVTLAAAVKAAAKDATVVRVAKLLKVSEQQFKDIVDALEMHAEAGTETAKKYRREHFTNSVIMVMLAIKGFTIAEAKKWLKKNSLDVKISTDRYCRLANGTKGWEIVTELLNIHVVPKVVDHAEVKKALESGLSVREVMKIFNIGLALAYEIKNGRKYTPRL